MLDKVHAPFQIIGKIWRKLKEQRAKATIIVPLWTSATWWHLIAPDAIHLSEIVVDWMWLPRNDPSLFVSGQTPGGRVISPPDCQAKALWVDFYRDRTHIMNTPISNLSLYRTGGGGTDFLTP